MKFEHAEIRYGCAAVDMDYLSKARKLLSARPQRPVILVLGGSFNPVHAGHVQMFDTAAAECKKKGNFLLMYYSSAKLWWITSAPGFDVVGGFMAVASNSHVRRALPSLYYRNTLARCNRKVQLCHFTSSRARESTNKLLQ